MATTVLFSEQKSFLWRIPNFAEVCKSDKMLENQQFKTEMYIRRTPEEPVTPFKWKYHLIPSGSTCENVENYFGVRFVLASVRSELYRCHANVRIQIGDMAKGQLYLDKEYTMRTASSQILTDSESWQNSNYLTADGSLEIKITVTVFPLSEKDSALASIESRYEKIFVNNLRAQLLALGKKPLDIPSTATKLVSSDGKEFSVDRVILATRSPVFRAMFQSGMNEQQSGVVEVKDVDSKPLEVLLHFIQTAKLLDWKDESVIEGLVYAAHKYMLKDLLEFLDEVLGLVCTDGNCGKLMVLANKFGMNKAQMQLLEYFKENLATSVDELLKFVKETATLTSSRIRYLDTVEQEQPEQPENKRLRSETSN